MSAALRLADGVLLAVDAAEGVMMVTDKVIKQAVAEGLPICLLLTKVDILSFSVLHSICPAFLNSNHRRGSSEQLHCELNHGMPMLPLARVFQSVALCLCSLSPHDAMPEPFLQSLRSAGSVHALDAHYVGAV